MNVCLFPPKTGCRLLAAWLMLCTSGVSSAASADLNSQDVTPISAKEIARLLYDVDDGDSEISKQVLSSCRYTLKDKRRVCMEKPRSKIIESVRKDYGDKKKDKRSISILLGPPAEKGVGFLQYDYDDQNKDADQWMYLSALGKVKRIVSGNDNEPKQGSFFGSEFSYEDMEQPHIDDYRYRLLKTVIYQGRPCWVLEITPTEQHARSTNYSKSINWIDKERFLSLKSVLYDRQGKRLKRLVTRRIQQIDGVWSPRLINIDNLKSHRMSTIKVERVAFNLAVDDNFLTLRTLTDGAFREQLLAQYRKRIQANNEQ